MNSTEDIKACDNQKSGNIITRKDLFKLLTEEIKDITEVDKVRGWTPWLILASLVSATWILIQDVWKGGYSWPVAIGIFLFVTGCIQVVVQMKGTLEQFSNRQTKSTFFLVQSDSSPLSILVLGLWFGSTAMAAYLFFTFDKQAIFAVFALLHATFMFVCCVITVSIMARLSMPISRKGRPVLNAVLFTAISILYVLVLINIKSSVVMVTTSLIDIRLGALVALCAYGVTVLSRMPSHSTKRETLADIRRGLILGETSIDEATHQTQVALRGMCLSDIVREDTRTLLGYISNVKVEHEDALRRIAALRETGLINQAKPQPSDNVTALALGSTLDALKAHESRINAISIRYYSLFANMLRRLEIITRASGVASEDVNTLVVEIKRVQTTVDLLRDQFIAEYMDIQKVWNAWFPKDERKYELFDAKRRKQETGHSSDK